MDAMTKKQLNEFWSSFVPYGEQDYDRLANILDTLIDQVGENEAHPLASMTDVIGILTKSYEDRYVPELKEVA